MREGVKKEVYKMIDGLLVILGQKLKEVQSVDNSDESNLAGFISEVDIPKETENESSNSYRLGKHVNVNNRINAWEEKVRHSMLSIIPELEREFIRNVNIEIEDFKREIENI